MKNAKKEFSIEFDDEKMREAINHTQVFFGNRFNHIDSNFKIIDENMRRIYDRLDAFIKTTNHNVPAIDQRFVSILNAINALQNGSDIRVSVKEAFTEEKQREATVIEKFKLTRLQKNIVKFMKDHNEEYVSVRDISDGMFRNMTTVTAHIRDLLKMGLIEQLPDGKKRNRSFKAV